MKKTVQQIFEESAQTCALLEVQGNKEVIITAIAAYQKGKKGDLVFVPNSKALHQAIENEVSAIVIPKKLWGEAKKAAETTTFFISANLGLSHALLKQKYGDHDYRRSGWGRIHPSAIVHESVTIPENTSLGPGIVIEQGAKIGNHCSIMANVVIEHDAVIGDYVQIHPGAIIGWECEIGSYCHILSNAVIGGEGFGFSQDQYFNHHRIPQTGNVEIGEKVTVGANTTIDRGTYGPTIIGKGCIIDNMCHIAHNVTMGENCIILSGFLCAGSTTLGNRVVASGGTMIKDHVNICDDTYLMHRAGVVKDITQRGMYAGSPVLPMKNYVMSNAIYSKLHELRQEVKELQKEKETGR